MGRHACRADQHAEAIAAGRGGKFRCCSRGPVGAENVRFKGDAKGLELLTAPLTTAQSESLPIITATFFIVLLLYILYLKF